jgi:hypothetical protein
MLVLSLLDQMIDDLGPAVEQSFFQTGDGELLEEFLVDFVGYDRALGGGAGGEGEEEERDY